MVIKKQITVDTDDYPVISHFHRGPDGTTYLMAIESAYDIYKFVFNPQELTITYDCPDSLLSTPSPTIDSKHPLTNSSLSLTTINGKILLNLDKYWGMDDEGVYIRMGNSQLHRFDGEIDWRFENGKDFNKKLTQGNPQS